MGADSKMDGAEKTTSEREKQDDLRGSGSQKKHKKHKKHKSKKKRRNREKEEKESSSESVAELEGGAKHHPRWNYVYDLQNSRNGIIQTIQ